MNLIKIPNNKTARTIMKLYPNFPIKINSRKKRSSGKTYYIQDRVSYGKNPEDLSSNLSNTKDLVSIFKLINGVGGTAKVIRQIKNKPLINDKDKKLSIKQSADARLNKIKELYERNHLQFIIEDIDINNTRNYGDIYILSDEYTEEQKTLYFLIREEERLGRASKWQNSNNQNIATVNKE